MTTSPPSSFTSPADWQNPYNAQLAVIWSVLSKVATTTLVQVKAVTTSGADSAVGFVDIQPLVSQVDGANNVNAYDVPISHCPYFRLQGGANAIILDPQVGDIGIAVFADRDITGVVQTQAAAPPGSGRMFSMSDGLYLGGVLNGVPSQYVQFNASGITINSPNAITLTAPTVTITAPTVAVNASSAVNITTPTLTLNGSLVVDGATTLNGSIAQTSGGGSGTGASLVGPLTVTNNVTGAGISLDTHHHTGVTTGTGSTGGPV